MQSMKSKLTKNMNIELAKGKIILFSDHGFDIVLKFKNMQMINNKNYYHDEFDPEYEQCDVVSILYCYIDSISTLGV